MSVTVLNCEIMKRGGCCHPTTRWNTKVSQSELPLTRKPQNPNEQPPQFFALEPILIPKLRIYFADFPYPHSSIDQRLLTLETWGGYQYGHAIVFWVVSINFSRTNQGYWGRCKGASTLPEFEAYLGLNPFQAPLYRLKRKENSFSSSGKRRWHTRVLPHLTRAVVHGF